MRSDWGRVRGARTVHGPAARARTVVLCARGASDSEKSLSDFLKSLLEIDDICLALPPRSRAASAVAPPVPKDIVAPRRARGGAEGIQGGCCVRLCSIWIRGGGQVSATFECCGVSDITYAADVGGPPGATGVLSGRGGRKRGHL